VLRDGATPGTAPAPTLAADLDGLLRRTRAGGQRVTAAVDTDPAALPPLVSREAYRIVQEGLSNALKHAGEPVGVRIAATDGHLEITVENPLGDCPAAGSENTLGGCPAPRPGGGHACAASPTGCGCWAAPLRRACPGTSGACTSDCH
jgi:hypothetical protein